MRHNNHSTFTWIRTAHASALAAALAFMAPLAAQNPVVIDGQKNIVISGATISNPTGICIDIKDNAQNIRIENSQIGPCGGRGIQAYNSSNITITNNYIHDTGERGIFTYQVNQVSVTNNRIETVGTGMLNLESTNVTVSGNSFKNMQGPTPGGQIIQFNKVTGPGNSITCNTSVNVAGQSAPQDTINMYASTGDPSSPILIQGNRIQGGGPSLYGGGIILGDGGGSYQVARDNILVDPGQYGVAVAGGQQMKLLNNMVYARQQSFTNVGLYVWDQYNSSCSNIQVEGNSINYTNKSGASSGSWNAGNCGTIAGWSDNNWYASIDASIINLPISACGGDTTAPQVSITSPTQGQTVSGSASVIASATDNVGVVGVQLQLDGTALGAEITAAPYSASVDTTKLSNGSHSVTAVARDAAGNSATSTAVQFQVQNVAAAPTVAITYPPSGAGTTASGLITIVASATSKTGIAGVTFRIDGTAIGAEVTAAPYSIQWNSQSVTAGAHALTAVARDTAGNTSTSSPVSINIVTMVPQTYYFSDLPYQVTANGWGPAEKDMSNGETLAKDGHTLTLNGVQYAKGLGGHAYSEIHYAANGVCSAFTAKVGIDDEVRPSGSVIFQVWGDGTKLYDSGLLTGKSATATASANVAGRKDVALIVTDGGDGGTYDHADWAAAQITCTGAVTRPPSGTTYVSDLPMNSMLNGWGPVEKDMSNGETNALDGHTLTISGVTYAKGLGAHSISDVHYYIGSACSTFAASVGVDSEVGSAGSVTFQVWGDGVKLAESPVLRGTQAAYSMSVTVTGKSDLELVVTDGGDGGSSDHADWANAKVTCN